MQINNPSSLLPKIAAIQADPRAQKLVRDTQINDRSGKAQYKVLSASAVNQAFAPMFQEHKLILFPQSIPYSPITQAGKYDSTVTTLTFNFRLLDLETGEFIDIAAAGQGFDGGDKGAGSAQTYAMKYAIRSLFYFDTLDDADMAGTDAKAAQLEDREIQQLRARARQNHQWMIANKKYSSPESQANYLAMIEKGGIAELEMYLANSNKLRKDDF